MTSNNMYNRYLDKWNEKVKMIRNEFGPNTVLYLDMPKKKRDFEEFFMDFKNNYSVDDDAIIDMVVDYTLMYKTDAQVNATIEGLRKFISEGNNTKLLTDDELRKIEKLDYNEIKYTDTNWITEMINRVKEDKFAEEQEKLDELKEKLEYGNLSADQKKDIKKQIAEINHRINNFVSVVFFGSPD